MAPVKNTDVTLIQCKCFAFCPDRRQKKHHRIRDAHLQRPGGGRDTEQPAQTNDGTHTLDNASYKRGPDPTSGVSSRNASCSQLTASHLHPDSRAAEPPTEQGACTGTSLVCAHHHITSHHITHPELLGAERIII